MKILLTGGAGYIGSHTAIELMALGHEVIIVDNLVNASEKVLERIKTISGVSPKFYRADCCDMDAMDKLFAENEIDTVIHFAGLKAVGESCRMPIEYYKNNTIILVSHRVENIDLFDQIIRIEQGNIIENLNNKKEELI